MVSYYVLRIELGFMTYADLPKNCPKNIKNEVLARLIEDGYYDMNGNPLSNPNNLSII